MLNVAKRFANQALTGCLFAIRQTRLQEWVGRYFSGIQGRAPAKCLTPIRFHVFVIGSGHDRFLYSVPVSTRL